MPFEIRDHVLTKCIPEGKPGIRVPDGVRVIGEALPGNPEEFASAECKAQDRFPADKNLKPAAVTEKGAVMDAAAFSFKIRILSGKTAEALLQKIKAHAGETKNTARAGECGAGSCEFEAGQLSYIAEMQPQPRFTEIKDHAIM